MPYRFRYVALICSLALAPDVSAQATAKSAEVLTNQTVIQMVLGKLPKDVILAKIQASRTDFDVTIAGLVGLRTNKVPTDIMKSMMAIKQTKPTGEVLTNESVIQMVTAKLPKDVILAKIQSTKTNFDTSTDGLVSLNTNKVPKDVIQVMLVGG